MTANTTRRERTDATTVLTLGAAAAVFVVVDGWHRLTATFRPDGIGWHLPVDAQTVHGTVGSGTGAVDVLVERGLAVAPDVNAVSVTMIVTSLVASMLTALVVIGCVMLLAWHATRGTVFAARMVRVWDILGWTLVIGPTLMLIGDTLGGNGVLAALGLADADVSATPGVLAFAPLWAVGVACGLVGIAFRRGLALQRDTEGLV